MTYQEICEEMSRAGWGSHAVLCLKDIDDPFFDRKGRKFCTVGNIKRLDTYSLYQQFGPAPDLSDLPGEPVDFVFYEPGKGGGTNRLKFKAWLHREKDLVEFINNKGKHLVCALSDVGRKLEISSKNLRL